MSVLEMKDHVLVIGVGDKEMSLLASWKKEEGDLVRAFLAALARRLSCSRCLLFVLPKRLTHGQSGRGESSVTGKARSFRLSDGRAGQQKPHQHRPSAHHSGLCAGHTASHELVHEDRHRPVLSKAGHGHTPTSTEPDHRGPFAVSHLLYHGPDLREDIRDALHAPHERPDRLRGVLEQSRLKS